MLRSSARLTFLSCGLALVAWLNTSCGSAATCTDGVKNGRETDLDCGGTCRPCADGKACAAAADCKSKMCTGGRCMAPAPSCVDGVKNGSESDVDCGGGVCPLCAGGKGCLNPSDCTSGACNAGGCAPDPTCTDGIKNGAETDVDCGGGTCPPCANGKTCALPSDCQGGACTNLVCATSTCPAACNTPPGPACSQNVLTSYGATGSCVVGNCTYPPTNTTCPYGCFNGACSGKLTWVGSTAAFHGTTPVAMTNGSVPADNTGVTVVTQTTAQGAAKAVTLSYKLGATGTSVDVPMIFDKLYFANEQWYAIIPPQAAGAHVYWWIRVDGYDGTVLWDSNLSNNFDYTVY